MHDLPIHIDTSSGSLPSFGPAGGRFIRLGPGGRWAEACIGTGTLRFGVPGEPHDLCLAGDWQGVHDALEASGMAAKNVSELKRELRDFYGLGPDALWITFAQGRMWWGFAEAEVTDLRQHEDGHTGVVARRIRGGWSCRSALGDELLITHLGSRITQVRGYQRSICALKEFDAVWRAIRGADNAAVARTLAAEDALVEAVAALVAGLHEADFEILADLTLAASGWRRRSRLGGTLVDADLYIEQPASGELALVQVKSRAGQAVLDDYVARSDANGCDRLFLLCHTPEGGLDAGGRADIHVWSGRTLAEKVVAAGLTPWVIAQAR